MSTLTEDGAPRLYGNWRRARGFGVGDLSTAQSLILFVAVLVPILLMYVAPKAALLAAGVSVVIGAVVLVRIGGQSVADVTGRRMRFGQARRAGWLELSGGILTDHPRQADLPGPMAPVVPLCTDDGRGGQQGLLWDRRTGYLTAVIRVSPVGLDLADKAQADAWVAHYGAWLADLGYKPMVRWIAVTVDTAPAGGATLADYIAARVDPTSPAPARAVLQELVDASPATVADVDTRVSITFDPSRANPRPPDLLAAVAEVTRWLPGLEAGLSACGVAVLGRASVEWILGRLRIAYDPAARADVARRGGHTTEPNAGPTAGSADELLPWSEAGPMRASETWDQWQHDSGISVSWALSEAPRQAVVSRVLTPLLAPGPYPRRVTLLYVPIPAEQAADEVQRQITHGQLRAAVARRTRRDETQRERDDRQRAFQSAQEEAEGAGVGKFTLYVCTTVPTMEDPAKLLAATADVEQRAGQCKLRLRRMRGAQSAGFAAALGLGINPTELARRGWR